jgi:hypothetical protein
MNLVQPLIVFQMKTRLKRVKKIYARNRKKIAQLTNTYFFLVATGVAPWIQRASDMKAEVVMNHDMERKLQQHSDEIVKLIKDVKFKVIQK